MTKVTKNHMVCITVDKGAPRVRQSDVCCSARLYSHLKYNKMTHPSCALPQALSSMEQAHAGDGPSAQRYMQCGRCAVGFPSRVRRACLLCLFLAAIPGSGISWRKLGLRKQWSPISFHRLFTKLSGRFETFRPPLANNQLWPIGNALNSS